MSNIYTLNVNSTILANKLKTLLANLQSTTSSSGTADNQTYEDVASKAYALISYFYSGIKDPIFDPEKAISWTDPEMDEYNSALNGILGDLEVIFREFETVETAIIGSFNSMTSRLNRLKTRLKQASSRLGDYSLYSTIKMRNYIYFSDSFNNLERIQSRSSLLKEEELEVNQDEGILTLPLDMNNQESVTTNKSPVLNSASNGVPGNNYEDSAITSSTATGSSTDMMRMLDYNPDTWFEYERVVDVDDGVPLVLDFTIPLDKAAIVNFIRINPNNFGTKTELEVTAIETSLDGSSYKSIVGDLLAPDLVDPVLGTLVLGPSTSKYAGQGIYSFTPRKVKYIRVALKQSTPYSITTTAGTTKLRYAIGIKDIHVLGRRYKDKGEVVSKTFNFATSDPARKVMLASDQSPKVDDSSPLGNISHFISPDNGVTWYQIRPASSRGVSETVQEVPELLDFNGVANNTITTGSPITSLRYKAYMERNSDAFSADSTSGAEELITTELHQAPNTTPFSITLQNVPVDGTVKVIDPFLGSRGIEEYRYQVQVGHGDEQRITLPWSIKRDNSKTPSGTTWYLSKTSAPVRVFIDGQEWEQGALSSAGASDKYFQVAPERGRIDFGDNITGRAPSAGSPIEVLLDEERLYPSSDSFHCAELDYPTAPDRDEVQLYLVRPITVKTVVLEKGANVHQVDEYLDSAYTVVFSDTTVFSSVKTFIDGSVELTTAGDYSIDYEKGVIYSYTRTVSTGDTSCSYRYTPREKVSSTGYSFDNSSGLNNKVSISKEVWESFEPDNPETVPTSVKYFNLGNLSVVKGSIKFSGTNWSSIFAREVPFVDGRIELLGVKEVKEKLSAITVSVPGTSTISLSLQIASSTDLDVSFTNTTIFSTEVADPALVTSDGRYYIYRTSGNPRVLVYLSSSVTYPGFVTYYYNDPNVNLSGVYSINYNTGEVFTKETTISGLTVNYRYTDYRLRYPIAREVNSTDYEVNSKNKMITLKDREIVRRKVGVKRGDSALQGYYRISYRYAYKPNNDIGEYEEYYSPVVSSYQLKVVTESKLS